MFILKDTKAILLKTTCKFPSLQCFVQGQHSGWSCTSEAPHPPPDPRKSHLKQLETIHEHIRIFSVPAWQLC